MRDDEGRAIGHEVVHCSLDALLGAGIDRTRGLIEHQHAAVGQKRARYGEQLALASADVAGGVKIGAGLSITADGILSATGGGTADAVEWDNVVGKPDDLLQAGDVYSKEEIDSKVSGVYSKEEIDAKVENIYSKEEIDAKVNAVYKFKGSVDGLVALPAEGNVTGDVYNLKDTGMNVAWDGTQWDYLGVDVDLSGYVQAKDLVEAKDEQIDALFA